MVEDEQFSTSTNVATSEAAEYSSCLTSACQYQGCFDLCIPYQSSNVRRFQSDRFIPLLHISVHVNNFNLPLAIVVLTSKAFSPSQDIATSLILAFQMGKMHC